MIAIDDGIKRVTEKERQEKVSELTAEISSGWEELTGPAFLVAEDIVGASIASDHDIAVAQLQVSISIAAALINISHTLENDFNENLTGSVRQIAQHLSS